MSPICIHSSPRALWLPYSKSPTSATSLYLIFAQLLFIYHTEARKILLQLDYRTLKWLLTTLRIQIKPYLWGINPTIRVQPNFANTSLFSRVYTPLYPSRDSDTLNFFVFFQWIQLFLTLGPLQLVFPVELSSTRSACIRLMKSHLLTAHFCSLAEVGGTFLALSTATLSICPKQRNINVSINI